MADSIICVTVNTNKIDVATEMFVGVQTVTEDIKVTLGDNHIGFTDDATDIGVTVEAIDLNVTLLRQGEQGAAGVSEDEMTFAQQVDFTNDGNTIYRAEAAVGSSVSSAVWRIRKIDIAGDDDTVVTWADGVDTFSKVWDDRLTYTYS